MGAGGLPAGRRGAQTRDPPREETLRTRGLGVAGRSRRWGTRADPCVQEQAGLAPQHTATAWKKRFSLGQVTCQRVSCARGRARKRLPARGRAHPAGGTPVLRAEWGLACGATSLHSKAGRWNLGFLTPESLLFFKLLKEHEVYRVRVTLPR